MADINLHMSTTTNVTYVSNAFIDYYMKDANGEFVKIYLYLLRALSQNNMDFSIAAMADALGHTQLDIRRALTYWEGCGLLSVRCDSTGEICDICLNEPAMRSMSFTMAPTALEPLTLENAPAPVSMPVTAAVVPAISTVAQTVSVAPVTPAAPSAAMTELPSNVISIEAHTYSTGELDSFNDNHEVQEIMYIAERYLGHTLTPTDTNHLLYWYDGLSMSVDLIEHLMAHCVDLGKTSTAYMNKVAIAWASEGIHTVAEANKQSESRNDEVYTVMRSFGISGRSFTPAELEYVNRWFNEWAFSSQMVEEACKRTIISTGKAQFPYADSILCNWHNTGVTTLAQLPDSDQKRRKKYDVTPRNTGTASNKFHNYKEAPYDFSTIESQLLQRKY